MYWSVKVWFCSLVTLVAMTVLAAFAVLFANVTPPPIFTDTFTFASSVESKLDPGY